MSDQEQSSDKEPTPDKEIGDTIPRDLQQSFSKAEWDITNPSLTKVISGGPGKDGIPSIDKPQFVPIDTFQYADTVQAIVLQDKDTTKVYPYNILNWHEIVNDTIDGIPVAVTFCPLCGSAIVFDRRVNDTILTFGVSGFLLESNMIMFDRENEYLWQQSTGNILAGDNLDTTLELIPFQLMTIAEIKEKYPKALILSDNTGYNREYGSNPYSGYEDSEQFIFPPTQEDLRYPAKNIFVAFRLDNNIIGIPYSNLENGQTYTTTIQNNPITITRNSGEITISNPQNNEIPFYFEMWFSLATQHGANIIVFDPKK